VAKGLGITVVPLYVHFYRSKVSPVIGAHVGPRVLEVAVLGDK